VEVSVKLYTNRFSPNSRRTLLVAASVDLPIERIEVDLRAGQQREPWYVATNPNHKVPTLVDGDLRLWESNAINQYLAAKAGRTDLWPIEPEQQADVSRWQLWTHTHLNLALNPVLFETTLKARFGMGAPDEAVVAAKLPELRVAFAVLEGQLAGRTWLTLERTTLADFSIGGSLTWAVGADLPLADYPNLSAWFARIRELPAWKATDPTS
jgi:glutathione S-transferase